MASPPRVLETVAQPKTELFFIASCSYLTSSQHLAVVGSIEELGSWDVQKAVLMETKTERFPNWTATVLVNTGQVVHYKYIVVMIGKNKTKTLIRWEALEDNRTIVASGIKHSVNDGPIGQQADHLAVNIDPGWIGNSYQLRIFFGSRDPKHRFDSSGADKREYSGFTFFEKPSEPAKYRPHLVPLNKLHYLPGSNPCRDGHAYGFVAPTVEDLGVSIHVWEYTSKSRRRVGKAVLTWKEIEATKYGYVTRPILSDACKVIGEMYAQICLITPFQHPENNVKNIAFYQWKPHVNVIGHRGFGATSRTFVAENTLLSFNTAHQFGIRYVEFDVHVTKDGVPVIFHDFLLEVSKDLHIKTSIANLTLKQFKAVSRELAVESAKIKEKADLDLARAVRTLKRSTSVGFASAAELALKWKIADSEFATLEELFKKLPPDVGFNVEIKYPHPKVLREVGALERNEFLDPILKVVFDHAGTRPLFFSSFDPDLCVYLAKKQPKYPVFFLTEGRLGDRFEDFRCTSLRNSIKFAHLSHLRGVVSCAAPVLEDLEAIQEAHVHNLLLFTYGADNNDPEKVDIQKRHGVDAVISDKVTKIHDAARAPVNEIVERNLTLALNAATEKMRQLKLLKKAKRGRRERGRGRGRRGGDEASRMRDQGEDVGGDADIEDALMIGDEEGDGHGAQREEEDEEEEINEEEEDPEDYEGTESSPSGPDDIN